MIHFKFKHPRHDYLGLLTRKRSRRHRGAGAGAGADDSLSIYTTNLPNNQYNEQQTTNQQNNSIYYYLNLIPSDRILTVMNTILLLIMFLIILCGCQRFVNNLLKSPDDIQNEILKNINNLIVIVTVFAVFVSTVYDYMKIEIL